MGDDPSKQIHDSEDDKPQNGEQPHKEVKKRLDQMAQPRHFGGAGVEKKG